MKGRLLVLLTFVSLLKCFYAYPDGAPNSACRDMLPHHGVDPQSSSPPFQIIAVKSGDSILVTIEGRDNGTQFRGFLIKAFQEDFTPVKGEFQADESMTKTVDCNYGKNGALTHSNNHVKSKIVATWQSLDPINETIIFKATVVLEKVEFWVNILSNKVLVDSPGIGTSTTDPQVTSQKPDLDLYSGCGVTTGCFGVPGNCLESKKCEILLTYAINEKETDVEFQLAGLFKSEDRWIAVGLSRDTKMGNDSVTECVYFNNTILIRESWNYDQPRRGNMVLPDEHDITNERGQYVNNVMTCSWSRPVFTIANKVAFNLSAEYFYLLLARGPVDKSGNKRFHDLYEPSESAVDLTSFELVQAKKPLFIKIHGITMTLAWVGFISIAIMLARHYKRSWTDYNPCGVKVWFAIHRCLMMLSVGLIATGFIFIFLEVRGWSQIAPNPHPILGCIATAFAILQPFIAFVRPATDSPKRPIFRWIHGLVGYGGQTIALANMFFAVNLRNANLPQAFVWILTSFIIFHCFMHFSIHIHSYLTESEDGYDTTTKKPCLHANGKYAINDVDSTEITFKNVALGLYCAVTIALTATLIAMICLS